MLKLNSCLNFITLDNFIWNVQQQTSYIAVVSLITQCSALIPHQREALNCAHHRLRAETNVAEAHWQLEHNVVRNNIAS